MTIPPLPRDDHPDPDRDGRELILSEERLVVSTVEVPARRVRLEKFVVTQTRTITVEVSHEEVRLVDLDLTDARPAGEPLPTVDVEPGRWLTLSEQRIVVTTETVPVERVRLQVSSVVEHREVTGTVRREHIEREPATPQKTDPWTT